MAMSDTFREFKQSATPSGVGAAVSSGQVTFGRFAGMHAWSVGGGVAASWLRDEMASWTLLEDYIGRYGEDAVCATLTGAAGYLLTIAASGDPRMPIVKVRLPQIPAQYRGAVNQFVAGMMGWWGTEIVDIIKALGGRVSDWYRSRGSGAQGTEAAQGLDDLPNLDRDPEMIRQVIAALANSPETLKRFASFLGRSVAEVTGAQPSDVEKSLVDGFGHLARAFA